ncbi:alpha/beta hydrolase [Nocardioides sp. zg-536]|uniref:Alpha/beta hydrolase n=1 Tax=Nocardioides faecalis TaxID=2803858 RepID=A0A938Y1C0_9ACTN|nr:alpha/beta hydrolase [Nocardioides faecalis]MBM9460352.1 alpha/beta hydrolase [Nocardioides faecalis]MBS4751277.1 alpha/beta hydrolase [Nocardioides faecalis]QVI59820.1 alpha/beta hydrolase [Nocardioides faecalis]
MALTEEGIVHVPGMLSRYVRLSTGVKVHYMTSGETGPAVVLLHGGINGSSGTAGWRFMAPFLGAHGFRVYAPDMPSYGLTDDPHNYYGYGRGGHVDFIHDFVRQIGVDEFHLAGNSMGCANTVQYAMAHPEQVKSMALIAGTIGDIVPLDEVRKADGRRPEEYPKIVFDGTEASMRHMLEQIILDPSLISEELVTMRTEAANRHADTYDGNLRRMINPVDVNEKVRLRTRDRLNELDIPAIYLYGRQDVVFRVEAGHLMEDRLPNIQFFYPDDTGHQGQTDQPELFNDVFLEFFRDGRVSWETSQRAGISDRRPPLPSLVEVPDPVPTS